MKNKYWVIGSNKWSKELYTKEEAKQYAKTLINCENCIDCRFCQNCQNCDGLLFCQNCQNCCVCTHSRWLNDCVDVYYSAYLTGAREVEFTQG